MVWSYLEEFIKFIFRCNYIYLHKQEALLEWVYNKITPGVKWSNAGSTNACAFS